jgi:hypothetical protein
MLTQAQAQKLLEPYLQTIKDSILLGFNYYHRRYADESHRHQARSRANLVNDHIVDNAYQRLTRFSGVRPLSVFGRRLFQIHDQLLLHFKKLDRQKHSSNYPTLFAMDFNKQLELPGLPATLPRLIAGFVPSRDWTRVEAVYITCPSGSRVAWFLDLTADTQQLETIELSKIKDERLRVPRKRVRARGAGHARDAREANS